MNKINYFSNKLHSILNDKSYISFLTASKTLVLIAPISPLVLIVIPSISLVAPSILLILIVPCGIVVPGVVWIGIVPRCGRIGIIVPALLVVVEALAAGLVIESIVTPIDFLLLYSPLAHEERYDGHAEDKSDDRTHDNDNESSGTVSFIIILVDVQIVVAEVGYHLILAVQAVDAAA